MFPLEFSLSFCSDLFSTNCPKIWAVGSLVYPSLRFIGRLEYPSLFLISLFLIVSLHTMISTTYIRHRCFVIQNHAKHTNTFPFPEINKSTSYHMKSWFIRVNGTYSNENVYNDTLLTIVSVANNCQQGTATHLSWSIPSRLCTSWFLLPWLGVPFQRLREPFSPRPEQRWKQRVIAGNHDLH